MKIYITIIGTFLLNLSISSSFAQNCPKDIALSGLESSDKVILAKNTFKNKISTNCAIHIFNHYIQHKSWRIKKMAMQVLMENSPIGTSFPIIIDLYKKESNIEVKVYALYMLGKVYEKSDKKSLKSDDNNEATQGFKLCIEALSHDDWAIRNDAGWCLSHFVGRSSKSGLDGYPSYESLPYLTFAFAKEGNKRAKRSMDSAISSIIFEHELGTAENGVNECYKKYKISVNKNLALDGAIQFDKLKTDRKILK